MFRLSTRAVTAVLAAALASCAPGVGDPDAGREPCTKQTDCSTEHQRACVDGLCTGRLDEPALVSVNVYVGGAIRTFRSYRSFVFHTKTPAGGTVACNTTTGQLKDRPAFTGTASDAEASAAYNATLFDPAQYNLTAFPAESNQVPANGDTYVIPVMLDGGPRVVYLEFYERALSASTPGGEGPPVASICLAGVMREDPPGGGLQNIGGSVEEW